ncbi:MAG TPA: peptidoglycan-binding domain-containing protein, partial [Vicinamibacterales bacterium]|nr:peptidoglycan-binding domain-containing protein [Vicinamibacterales bacterium]
MAVTGIAAIDALLDGSSDVALDAGNCDAETAGFLQDLLIGHGFGNLPGILGTGRGRFGPHTSSAIRQFQQAQSLPITGTVDRTTLRALVDTEWPRPFACCAYLTLVLDVAFIGTMRLVSLTSQFEGAGLFTALNRNTDRAGLSFGLIQWAQRPGRLHELLRAFRAANSELFTEIFGNGDQTVAQALLEHTVKVRGGTDANGRTIDPRFDLISPPWDSRFIEAGRHRELQVVQLDTAVADFQRSLSRLRLF